MNRIYQGLIGSVAILITVLLYTCGDCGGSSKENKKISPRPSTYRMENAEPGLRQPLKRAPRNNTATE